MAAGRALYNVLELPALHKYPILRMYQEHLRNAGAWGTLMSGSGSTTFGIFENLSKAQAAIDSFQASFGTEGWLKVVEL
jgi:4-diphosphocytidyl-2-C-methyl-D-erythritol kinase